MKTIMKSATDHLKTEFVSWVIMLPVWLLMVSFSFAQQTAVVEGRLNNGTDPAIVPSGVTLEVLALDGGMGIIRTAETDGRGRFRIEGLPMRSMLMLRAVYRGANYHQQIRFDENGIARVELDVFETTSSPDSIRVEEVEMVFQATGNHLQSLETTVLSNESNPPRTFMDPSGNFRFSKAPGIEVMPQIRITPPGSSMPVVQSALESSDGKSYYSLYPLRPGKTKIDVFQLLPYEGLNYTYAKKFFYKTPAVDIGVIPMDMEISGTGLSRVRTDSEKNLAVYRCEPMQAGTEVKWVFSGGTPVAEQESASESTGSGIQSIPNDVDRNAGIIAPLLLLALVAVLWYAFNRKGIDARSASNAGKRELKQRREDILTGLADLDIRFEKQGLEPKEYQRQRDERKRMLRRIDFLLKKK